MTVKDIVEAAIADNKIAIFSKSWCPYCGKAKKLLESEFPNVQKVIFELDERQDGDAIQNYLYEKTGQRTVPNVFIGKKHVGGSDDVAAAHRAGKLAGLVAA